jgi:6-phosphogluconolactonase
MAASQAVRVFDGDSVAADIASEIQEEVAAVAAACISEKGSFSIAIPGGSVVAAFGGIPSEALDFSKCHVFFCNEKIPSYQCLEGALPETKKLGIPDEQVYGVGEGTPAAVAESYTKLLTEHPSIDNSGVVPSFDMMARRRPHRRPARPPTRMANLSRSRLLILMHGAC